MNWINVNDKHFVNIEDRDDGGYYFEENENCPQRPFLVGLNVYNSETKEPKFEYILAVLSENGIEEWTEDYTQPWCSWDLRDIEYWCEIKDPE